MIYTAQVDDEGALITLVSLDNENYFPVPFVPESGDEDKIAVFIAPKSDRDKPYSGFSKS